MKILKLSIDELKEYAFCGLFYKYRRVLELPYAHYNAEDVQAEAVRIALIAQFRDWGMRRKSPQRVMSDAALLYKMTMSHANDSILKNPGQMLNLYSQGLIVLNTTHRYLRLSKDVVAATQLDHAVQLNDQTVIEDSLDAIVVKNDYDRSKRYYSLMTMINDQSPMATSSRFDDLHVGFARDAMIEKFNPVLDRPIVHQFFSLAGTTKASFKTSYHDIVAFKSVSTQLADGIRSNIFLPTAHASKCSSCWYNSICSNKFCSPVLPNKAIAEAKSSLLNIVENEHGPKMHQVWSSYEYATGPISTKTPVDTGMYAL